MAVMRTGVEAGIGVEIERKDTLAIHTQKQQEQLNDQNRNENSKNSCRQPRTGGLLNPQPQ